MEAAERRPLLSQVQLGLRCCGAASYRDWHRNPTFNCSAPGTQACSLPASCCVNPWQDGAPVNDQCGFGALGLGAVAVQGVVHLQGCGPLLRRWLRGNAGPGAAFGVLLMVAQAAELLLSAWLLRALAMRKGAVEGPGVDGGLGVSTPSPRSPCC
ncbi:tetraspanin-10 [Dasypus novemcinctus]|uniref:tetraspanin-10 n=1 Tax=Dasypus novemcinctus TaxID=9361 RepID=UPI00062AAB4E|nr:tetraspanin-10 [Dasypus novemcinctus]